MNLKPKMYRYLGMVHRYTGKVNHPYLLLYINSYLYSFPSFFKLLDFPVYGLLVYLSSKTKDGKHV